MKKMELDAALNQFLKNEDAEEYFWPDQMSGNRTIFDYSDIVGKEISFTPEENMSAGWFWSKAHVQPAPANNQYDIDFRGICDFVFAHVERELFTTLDALFFVFNEEGLDEVFDYTGDEYALECIDMDEDIGLMWYEKNIIVINVGLIQKSSEDLADEFRSAASHASDGIVMTIVHELRHLMLETNVLLPEEKYPDYEVTEAAVEEYTRQFADRWLLGNSVFVNRG